MLGEQAYYIMATHGTRRRRATMPKFISFLFFFLDGEHQRSWPTWALDGMRASQCQASQRGKLSVSVEQATTVMTMIGPRPHASYHEESSRAKRHVDATAAQPAGDVHCRGFFLSRASGSVGKNSRRRCSLRQKPCA